MAWHQAWLRVIAIHAGVQPNGEDITMSAFERLLAVSDEETLDLAREMIRLAGYTEDDIKIVYSGLRPGEKLYEEFYTDSEQLDMDKFQALGIVKNAPRRSRQELDKIIAELEQLFAADTNKAGVVGLLNKLLPNFQHIETGLNLDQKM